MNCDAFESNYSLYVFLNSLDLFRFPLLTMTSPVNEYKEVTLRRFRISQDRGYCSL